MARKPNYDFERREREKAKAAKTAERVKAKTANSSPQTDTVETSDVMHPKSSGSGPDR